MRGEAKYPADGGGAAPVRTAAVGEIGIRQAGGADQEFFVCLLQPCDRRCRFAGRQFEQVPVVARRCAERVLHVEVLRDRCVLEDVEDAACPAGRDVRPVLGPERLQIRQQELRGSFEGFPEVHLELPGRFARHGRPVYRPAELVGLGRKGGDSYGGFRLRDRRQPRVRKNPAVIAPSSKTSTRAEHARGGEDGTGNCLDRLSTK